MIYHSFFIVGKTSIRLISLFFPGFLWYTVYIYIYVQLYTYQYVYYITYIYIHLFHFIDTVLVPICFHRLVTSESLSSAGHEALDRAAKDRFTVLYAVPVAWESQLAALGICGVLW